MDLVRKYAIDVLTKFEQSNHRLKDIRETICKKYVVTGSDRQRLTAITNDVIRWRGRIDLFLNSLLDKPNRSIDPALKNIIRSGIYEIIFDDKTPDYAAVNSYVEIAKNRVGSRLSKFVNAVLRRASTIINEPAHDHKQHDWYSLPKWLWDKWVDHFGIDQAKTLSEHFLNPTSIDIRRNIHKTSHEELIQFGQENNVKLDPWENSDFFYRVKKNAAGLRPMIIDGRISVQDRAAGMVVELLAPKPNETILDVCAAPGSKAAYIQELIGEKGILFTFDKDPKRIEKVDLKLKVEVKDAEKDEYPKADVILIDAPCSGTGVIGKKPDIRWRRKKEEITEFAKLQKRILKHMSQFVNPGGRIIYSTCSLEPEENWGVVDAFLKLNDQFHVDKETKTVPVSFQDNRGALFSFPPENNTDGMFAVELINGSK